MSTPLGSRVQRVGLIGGAVGFLALLSLPAPAGMGTDGWHCAAIAALMAAWWITEAIPIPATALLPLVLLPALGLSDMHDAAAPYANDVVFLSMGGFIIALAMQRCGLHRRMALAIVQRVGTSPRRLVLGFMVASAFLSMWISNTATTALMLPIAIAVAEMFRPDDVDGRYDFGVGLMLAIAYAATIGGVSTLIGTPPNTVFAGAANQLLGIEVGFVEWMALGVPVAVVSLPLVWLVLTRWLYPPGRLRGDADALLEQERRNLGVMSRAERVVMIVFVAAALAWIFRSPKSIGSLTIPGIQSVLPDVRDSTIAIAAALALFLIPVDWRRGEFAMDWETTKKLPWGVMVLFGGGLSLAAAMQSSGLAQSIGSVVADLRDLPPWILIAVVAAMFVFLTEITSNLATCTMAMPVMAGAAVGLGISPLALMATAALSTSMAFMLPVATPPNAIAFGSGYITIRQMARAGLVLNLGAIVLVTLAGTLVIPLLFGR